jgi:hypothetical protein
VTGTGALSGRWRPADAQWPVQLAGAAAVGGWLPRSVGGWMPGACALWVWMQSW